MQTENITDMNKLRYIVALSLVILLGFNVNAGNKDRAGQAGAVELLINPWAASAGWGNAGMSSIKGVQSLWGNVAGAAFATGTTLDFSYTNWIQGSGVKVTSFGLLQPLGDAGVLGLSMTSLSGGDIPVTTYGNPDGTGTTYSPNLMYINFAFSKSFSSSIHAGLVVKVISESIADMGGTGVALDAGIQYVSGDDEQIHFGINLKNVGPTMRYSGDGLSIRTFLQGYDTQITMEQRTGEFEIPTQLNIAAAYDINFSELMRLTLAGNFTSNSFTKDQVTVGAEFAFSEYLVLRAGYTYEQGIYEEYTSENNSNVLNGLAAGISIQAPTKSGMKFCVDYALRQTSNLSGIHTIGARIYL